MKSSPPRSSSGDEASLDLKRSLRVIRHHRTLVLSLGVAGALAGLLFALTHPALPTATANILLPTELTQTTSSPGDGAQIAIAKGYEVLSAAGHAVTPPLTELQVKKRISVTSPTANLLVVQATSSKAGDAERLASAVARNYESYSLIVQSTTTGSALATLTTESDKLTSQLKSLNGEIASTDAELEAEAAGSSAQTITGGTLTGLVTQRNALQNELANISGETALDRAQSSDSDSALSLGPAQLSSPPALLVPTRVVIGLLLGLFLGAIISLARGQRSRGLVERRQIAAALDAPVLASVDAPRLGGTRQCNSLLNRYRPPPGDAWGLLRLLRHLVVGGDDGRRVDIQVVALAQDRTALAVGPLLAGFAASKGVSTAFMPVDHPAHAALTRACTGSDGASRPTGLSVFGPGHLLAGTDNWALTVTSVPVDRFCPELPSAHQRTIFAVSSGFATAEDLARLSAAAADSGADVDGVIVVNPSSYDRTGAVAPSLPAVRLKAVEPAQRPGRPLRSKQAELMMTGEHHDG